MIAGGRQISVELLASQRDGGKLPPVAQVPRGNPRRVLPAVAPEHHGKGVGGSQRELVHEEGASGPAVLGAQRVRQVPRGEPSGVGHDERTVPQNEFVTLL